MISILELLIVIINKTPYNDIIQSKGDKKLSKPVSSFPFLDELNLLESIYIRDVRRTQVRDAIRRYGDRKFGTKQVGNDVLVTRIQ